MQQKLSQVHKVLSKLLFSKPLETLFIHENYRVCLIRMHQIAQLTKQQVLLLGLADKHKNEAPQPDIPDPEVCFATSDHDNEHFFE